MRKILLLVVLIFTFCRCSSDDSSDSSSTTKAFNSSWTPQYTSIVGYWTMTSSFFSDGSILLADIGDNGTIRNPNNLGMSSISGPVSFALHFDGVDDRVQVPYNNNNNLNLFSVSLWLFVPSFGVNRSPISSRDAPVAKGYAFYVNSSGQPEIRIGKGNFDDWGVAIGVTLLQSTWTHIVFTYDGTYVRLYQNGALQASLLTAYMANTTQPLYLGAGGTENAPNAVDFFLGNIDEVAIWSSVLSDSDVQTIYQRQKL
ncbi:LamG domain-containing protein [Bdellovibrio sp. HCB337]|uniref:LamG domain-containing protein n=1 Tax=Bdellovibrio sp. HCB337 TaxID=3394358 RepID=UPI0039A50718